MMSCSGLGMRIAENNARAMELHEKRRIYRRKTLKNMVGFLALPGILLMFWIGFSFIIFSGSRKRRIPG